MTLSLVQEISAQRQSKNLSSAIRFRAGVLSHQAEQGRTQRKSGAIAKTQRKQARRFHWQNALPSR
jgi:hypothetical protein